MRQMLSDEHHHLHRRRRLGSLGLAFRHHGGSNLPPRQRRGPSRNAVICELTSTTPHVSPARPGREAEDEDLVVRHGLAGGCDSVGIRVDASDGYLVTVDYAVRFTRRGLFVHSAPWAVNSLGYENVSHGCVGLSTEDAEWYFNTVNVGDPVIVQENSIEVPRTVSRSRGSAPS